MDTAHNLYGRSAGRAVPRPYNIGTRGVVSDKRIPSRPPARCVIISPERTFRELAPASTLTRHRRAVLRIVDRTIMTLLMLLAAGMFLLWMRSYVVGDRYRWVELIEVSDGRTIYRTGDVWTGEGGVAV